MRKWDDVKHPIDVMMAMRGGPSLQDNTLTDSEIAAMFSRLCTGKSDRVICAKHCYYAGEANYLMF